MEGPFNVVAIDAEQTKEYTLASREDIERSELGDMAQKAVDQLQHVICERFEEPEDNVLLALILDPHKACSAERLLFVPPRLLLLLLWWCCCCCCCCYCYYYYYCCCCCCCVGLTMSLMLSRMGVESILVERSELGMDRGGKGWEWKRHPRAHVLHSRTMEIFRQIGIVDEVRALSPPVSQWRHFRYCTSLIGEDLSVKDHLSTESAANLERHSPETIAHVSQPRLEDLLLEKASAWPCAEIIHGARFDVDTLSRCSSEGSIESNIVAHGEEMAISARHVVAADGASSPIRKSLGIALRGEKSLERFASIHFSSKDLWPLMLGRGAMLYFVFNPRMIACVVAHDVEAGEWVAQVPFFLPQPASDFEDESRCRELVRACIGGTDDVDFEIQSSRAWSMDALVADRFQNETADIHLVGDAAHQFPPAGGFGLNTGIQDAHNLAWKLASCDREDLLPSYSSERWHVAKSMAEESVRNHKRGSAHPLRLGWTGKICTASPACLRLARWRASHLHKCAPLFWMLHCRREGRSIWATGRSQKRPSRGWSVSCLERKPFPCFSRDTI